MLKRSKFRGRYKVDVFTIIFICLSTEKKEKLEHACSSLNKTTSVETADVSELPKDAVKTFKGMSDLEELFIHA